MKSIHTPGPWYLANPVTVQSAPLDTDNYICTVEGRNDDEIKANAALIAAAPELYSALDNLLGCCELNLDDMEDDTHKRIAVAVAALKKARGK